MPPKTAIVQKKEKKKKRKASRSVEEIGSKSFNHSHYVPSQLCYSHFDCSCDFFYIVKEISDVREIRCIFPFRRTKEKSDYTA